MARDSAARRPGRKSPSGTSTGVVPRDTVPFDGIEFFPHEDPHADWWNGSGEADRDRTISNNTMTREDRDGDDDDSEGFATTTGEDYTGGNFPIDVTMEPDTYTDATVVNLFYWMNRLHDFWYRFGLDEEAGNAQTDNFGLGGMDNDAVQADAQDGQDTADPPTCNAFMNAGADGDEPRTKYFVCDDSPVSSVPHPSSTNSLMARPWRRKPGSRGRPGWRTWQYSLRPAAVRWFWW